jgi:hypothetical protein
VSVNRCEVLTGNRTELHCSLRRLKPDEYGIVNRFVSAFCTNTFIAREVSIAARNQVRGCAGNPMDHYALNCPTEAFLQNVDEMRILGRMHRVFWRNCQYQ